MARHSKNNCSSSVFTYAEKQKLTYGTQKQRLGKDSLKDWDACGLCLQPLVDPQACPQGHLYCRECIYESLLQQKQESKRLMKEWEVQEQRKKEEEQKKQQEKQEQEVFEFTKTDSGLLPQKIRVFRAGANNLKPSFIPNDVESFTGPDGKTYYLDRMYHSAMDKKQQFEAISAVRRQLEIAKGLPSFWVPSKGPDTIAVDVAKPSEETICTEGNHPLRLKQLIKVHLTPAAAAQGTEGDMKSRGKEAHMCPVCRRVLTNAPKTALLKGCGHVMCQSCVTNYVSKERKCFVCTVPCSEKDIIKIQEGGTGYSGHGEQLVSKKHTPAAWV